MIYPNQTNKCILGKITEKKERKKERKKEERKKLNISHC